MAYTPAQFNKAVQNNPKAKAKLVAGMKAKAAADEKMRQAVAQNYRDWQASQASQSQNTPQQDDAVIRTVTNTLNEWGLGDLWQYVTDQYRKGVKSADAISALMMGDNQTKLSNGQTPQQYWNARFPANEIRKQKGLPTLLPGAYVTLEKDMAQKMSAAGLPPGFYDDPKKDFVNLIADDVSPAEVQERVNMARQAAVNADPTYVDQLNKMYGVTQADLVAHFLDPDKTLELLRNRQNAATFNATAVKNGQEFSTQFAEEAGNTDAVHNGQAESLFGGLRDEFLAASQLNGVYDESLSKEDIARQAFNMAGAGAVGEKRARLASKERAAFGGRSSTGSAALNVKKDL